MPISKEDDKSLWEQYHIILLSHIVLYWIWSLLDLDESLVVTRVSPPIFCLQHCGRFSKRMQLNMGGLPLNTLFLYFLFHHLYLFFLFFFFNFPSFCSLYFFLLVLYWIWSLLDSDERLVVTRVSPPIFRLKHCGRKRMQLNMGGLRLNTLFLYFLFDHLYLFFLFFFFNFPSFCSLYFFFFYFLLQPVLIVTGLSWCHKFQPHFMSLIPQIKGMFIKIERFKMKSCPSQKKMTRVCGSNIT